MSQNKAFSTPFILAVLCIYFSYFLHGISVITLAQNMTSLAEKFSTDNAGIAYLISGIGLGRLTHLQMRVTGNQHIFILLCPPYQQIKQTFYMFQRLEYCLSGK